VGAVVVVVVESVVANSHIVVALLAGIEMVVVVVVAVAVAPVVGSSNHSSWESLRIPNMTMWDSIGSWESCKDTRKLLRQPSNSLVADNRKDTRMQQPVVVVAVVAPAVGTADTNPKYSKGDSSSPFRTERKLKGDEDPQLHY